MTKNLQISTLVFFKLTLCIFLARKEPEGKMEMDGNCSDPNPKKRCVPFRTITDLDDITEMLKKSAKTGLRKCEKSFLNIDNATLQKIQVNIYKP